MEPMEDIKNIECDQPWDQDLVNSEHLATFASGIKAITATSTHDTTSLAISFLQKCFLQSTPQDLALRDAEFLVLYFAAMRQTCTDLATAETMVRLLNDVQAFHPQGRLDSLELYWDEVGSPIAYCDPDMRPANAAWTTCTPIYLASATWSAVYFLDGADSMLRARQLSSAEVIFTNAFETVCSTPLDRAAMKMYLEPAVTWLEQAGSRILDICAGKREDEERAELKKICSPYRSTGIIEGGGMWSWAGGHDFTIKRWEHWTRRLEQLLRSSESESDTENSEVQMLAERGLVALKEAEEKRGGLKACKVRRFGKRIDLAAFVEPEIVWWGL